MAIPTLIVASLGAVLDLSDVALQRLGTDRVKTLLSQLGDHFSLSATDLAQAYQDAFRLGMSAISLGIAPAEWGGRPDSRDRMLTSTVPRDFASNLDVRLFAPFAQARGLGEDDKQRLRQSVARHCRSAARRVPEILPVSEFPVGPQALALLSRDTREGDLCGYLVEQIGQAGLVLPSNVIAVLRHEGLLGDAILFFLRDRLRGDARVRMTRDLLRQDLLRAGLDVTRASTLRLEDEFRRLSDLWASRPEALDRALETLDCHLLEAARPVIQGIGVEQGQNDAILSVVTEIADLLRNAGRDNDIHIDHAPEPGSTVGNSAVVPAQDLGEPTESVGRVPGAAMTLAAGRASIGDDQPVAEAERLLEEALETASDPSDQARIAYTLYQVRLLRRAFDAALGPLSLAISLDPRRYAPCDVIGERDLKYPIRRILGAGGTGCVFLCDDVVRGLPVALKVLWKSRPGPLPKMFAEFQAMVSVDGGIVPRAIDFGISPGNKEPYIVMEYLDGFLDGEDWLKRHGTLSVKDTAVIGARVARALATAHRHEPVPLPHLDLKPANLMLRRADAELEFRLIDWGLARMARTIGADRGTRSSAGTTVFGQGVLMATPGYAPPEQMAKGDPGPPGPQSDIFALGKTLYRLATAADSHTVCDKRLGRLGTLGDVIKACLEDDPQDRPDADTIADRLERVTGSVSGSEDANRRSLRQQNPTRPAVRPSAPPRAPVEVLEGAWPHAGCVFRDWGSAGQVDDTLPELVVIPAGEFWMGSPDDEPERFAQEGPRHRVRIARPFALGRYTVTQRQWVALMGDNPSHFKGCDRPVDAVSWTDCKAFIAALNARLGLDPEGGYRLPSEAEWEYACRAGSDTPFWWGATVTPAQANYDGTYPCHGGPAGQYREETVAVRTFQPNPFGLYQTHGNVWEWVEDCWADTYQGAPTDGVARISGDRGRRVLRGGSWSTDPWTLRSALRIWDTADDRFNDLGVRIARTLP